MDPAAFQLNPDCAATRGPSATLIVSPVVHGAHRRHEFRVAARNVAFRVVPGPGAPSWCVHHRVRVLAEAGPPHHIPIILGDLCFAYGRMQLAVVHSGARTLQLNLSPGAPLALDLVWSDAAGHWNLILSQAKASSLKRAVPLPLPLHFPTGVQRRDARLCFAFSVWSTSAVVFSVPNPGTLTRATRHAYEILRTRALALDGRARSAASAAHAASKLTQTLPLWTLQQTIELLREPAEVPEDDLCDMRWFDHMTRPQDVDARGDDEQQLRLALLTHRMDQLHAAFEHTQYVPHAARREDLARQIAEVVMSVKELKGWPRTFSDSDAALTGLRAFRQRCAEADRRHDL